MSNRTHAVPHPLRGTCLQNELLVSSRAIWKALWHVAGLVPVHGRYRAHSSQPQRLRGVPISALGRSGLEPFEHEFVFMRVFLSAHTSPSNSASAQRPSGFPPPACDGQANTQGQGTAHSRWLEAMLWWTASQRQNRIAWYLQNQAGRQQWGGFCFEILWPHFPCFLNFREGPTAPRGRPSTQSQGHPSSQPRGAQGHCQV